MDHGLGHSRGSCGWPKRLRVWTARAVRAEPGAMGAAADGAGCAFDLFLWQGRLAVCRAGTDGGGSALAVAVGRTAGDVLIADTGALVGVMTRRAGAESRQRALGLSPATGWKMTATGLCSQTRRESPRAGWLKAIWCTSAQALARFCGDAARGQARCRADLAMEKMRCRLRGVVMPNPAQDGGNRDHGRRRASSRRALGARLWSGWLARRAGSLASCRMTGCRTRLNGGIGGGDRAWHAASIRPVRRRNASASRRSIGADQPDQTALHLDLIVRKHAGLIGRVGRFECNRVAAPAETVSAWLPDLRPAPRRYRHYPRSRFRGSPPHHHR